MGERPLGADAREVASRLTSLGSKVSRRSQPDLAMKRSNECAGRFIADLGCHELIDCPEASIGSEALSRANVRHLLNGTPVSARKTRSSVRPLAPTCRPHDVSVWFSAGCRSSASATDKARPSAGIRTSIVVTSRGSSRSTSSAAARSCLALSSVSSPEILDQLNKERTSSDHRRRTPADRERFGPDVQRPHHRRTVGAHLVPRAGRNPERARPRQQPRCCIGDHREHPARRPCELIDPRACASRTALPGAIGNTQASIPSSPCVTDRRQLVVLATRLVSVRPCPPPS